MRRLIAETCLKYDATLNEVIERNAATPTAVKLSHQKIVQLIRQAKPEVSQRCNFRTIKKHKREGPTFSPVFNSFLSMEPELSLS